jgi:hypothetical protein
VTVAPSSTGVRFVVVYFRRVVIIRLWIQQRRWISSANVISSSFWSACLWLRAGSVLLRVVIRVLRRRRYIVHSYVVYSYVVVVVRRHINCFVLCLVVVRRYIFCGYRHFICIRM